MRAIETHSRSRIRSRAIALIFLFGSSAVAACGWDASKPFDREAPSVRDAIRALDAGDANAAAVKLEDYLSTGACSEGNIGTPDLVRRRPNGSFDLGLSLFKIGEAFGQRFGDEEADSGLPGEKRDERSHQIECALRVVRAIAIDDATPLPLRARSRYLEGNLLFLDSQYEEAVRAYDLALTVAPGEFAIDAGDAGDQVGRDAAWNRAIALRRIEDKKDAGQDGGNDASSDASQPDSGKPDSSPPDASDSGNDGGQDGGKDSGGDGSSDKKGDSGSGDGGSQNDAGQPPQNQQDAGAPPPPPKQNQDERMLDNLENAPTVQQEAARKLAPRRVVRGMEDK
jgi:hypothetical protein